MTLADTGSHLSIGEVLSLLQEEFPDVTISKIRFLESQGLLDPERTPSGYRKFYQGDIDQLRWILVQQREHFLPLKVIKDRLTARRDAIARGEDPDAAVAALAEPTSAPVADAAPLAEAQGNPSRPEPEAPAGDRSEPIWMLDAAKARSQRASTPARAGRDGSAPRSGAERSPLDGGETSVSLTAEELAQAAGLEPKLVVELERYGLLSGRNVGPEVYYDGDALVIAQRAAQLMHHGIEPRHLRIYKTAADREAGFLEQVVTPMMKQRNPEARRQARTTLDDLATQGQSLRAALLRVALRDHLG